MLLDVACRKAAANLSGDLFAKANLLKSTLQVRSIKCALYKHVEWKNRRTIHPSINRGGEQYIWSELEKLCFLPF